MARKYANLRNLRFLMHEVHEVSAFLQHPYYAHYDRESLDLMLDSALQLADSYLFPYYTEMDRQEPQLEEGQIRVHPSVRPYIRAMGEGGWLSVHAPLEAGGMQAPHLVGFGAGYLIAAANNSSSVFTGLTTGAANLLLAFASEAQKAYYLPKLFSGEWQGTMALTEPQAGSSLADITSSAQRREDGSYLIKGQKIYISAGDYTDAENVVHLTLARVSGAPRGTKGISLFIVPKYREENGAFVFNDITTAGLYHKMGQKGTPATHLMFGEKDGCIGYLVGQENQGLSYMFAMMNEARLMSGLGAAAIASAAYFASLQYAQERPQGRRLNNRDLDAPQTPIIQHPDVRRMLLFQKAISEGSLALLMECARYLDLIHTSEQESEKAEYDLLLSLLTPVAKTFPAEMGIQSVSQGLQVLGGGGFCTDFPLENYYRDIRIYAIYEGTTGIQSQDLLGRKIAQDQGKALRLLMREIERTLAEADGYEGLQAFAGQLRDKVQQLQEVTAFLSGFAFKGDIERFLADATLYMELFGLTIVGWQWLKQGCAAKAALVGGKAKGEEELNFYEGKLHTMRYYFSYELPKTLGLAARLMDPEAITLEQERAGVF